MSDLTMENYSDKCIVIRDNANMYSNEIIKLGGKYNDKLRGGAGWIFSRNMEKKLQEWISEKSNTTPTPTSTPEFKSSSDPLKYIIEAEKLLLETQRLLTLVKSNMATTKRGVMKTVNDDVYDEEEVVTTKKRLIK